MEDTNSNDSKAQQEHARENKEKLSKKNNNDEPSVVDKKLNGPNRPST